MIMLMCAIECNGILPLQACLQSIEGLNYMTQVLFSGDHLMSRASGELSMARDYNWHSVSKQVQSIAALRDLDIRVVLPGHGRRGYFTDEQDKAAKFEAILAREGR